MANVGDPEATRTHGSAAISRPAPSSRVALPIADPGQFAIHHEHGRGGLGRVLAADDRVLGRPVAIKELLSPGPDTAARLEREVRLTARLQHPAIVPIYQAGRWPDGSPFYVMKMVGGRSLKEAIAGAPRLDERIALLPHVIAVAEAIAYAHAARIVHRDLKPANVLLGEFGETVVIDWGIAADLADTDPAGAVVGTLPYMPPEQARGEATDERADVYALGSTLYFVLTGRAPYPASEPPAVLAGPPTRIVELESAAPVDLVAIAERAMARDPSARYPSASELAEDLRRFQTGKLVASHRYTWGSLAGRWLRAHRLPVALSAAFVAILAVGGAVGIARIANARDAAEDRRNHVVLLQARAELAHDPVASLAWLATSPITTDELPEVRAIFEEARDRSALAIATNTLLGVHSTDDNHFVILRRNDIVDFDPRTRAVKKHPIESIADVSCIDIDHSGHEVVLANHHELAVYDLVHDTRRIITLGGPSELRYQWCVISRDGRELGYGAAGGLGVAHLDTGALEVVSGTEPADIAMWFDSPDPATRVWNGTTGHVVHVVADGIATDRSTAALQPTVVGVTSDRRTIFAGTREGHVLAWPRAGGEPRDITVCTTGINRVAPLAGHGLAVHCKGDDLALVDLETGSVTALGVSSTAHGWLEATADGNAIIAMGLNMATVRDVHTGTTASVVYDDDAVFGTVTPDGAYFAVSSYLTHAIRVFRTPRPGGRSAAPGGLRAVYADARIIEMRTDTVSVCDRDGGDCRTYPVAGARWVAPSPDGQRLAFGTAARHGWIDLATGAEHATDGGAFAGTWSPSNELAIAAEDGNVQYRGASYGRGTQVKQLVFSRDGTQLAWSDSVGHVVLADVATDRRQAFDSTYPPTIAFDSAGVLVVGGGQELRTTSLARSTPDVLVHWHDRIDTIVAVASSGAIATTGTDHAVRAFDPTHRLVLHDALASAIGALALSNDGRALAAGGDDGTVHVWDVTSGDVHVLRGHAGAIVSASFSPDGSRLVTTSADRIVVWDLRALPAPITQVAELRAALAAETSVTLDADDHPVTSFGDPVPRLLDSP